MGKPCQQINVPTTNNDSLPCDEYVPCGCVTMTDLTGEVETYFNLDENPSLCESEKAIALSLIDARSRIAFLESVEAGGAGIDVQVNSDWNSVSGVSEILNKPILADVATSGDYNDLINTPTVSTAGSSGNYDDLINKPSLSAVATTNDYDDLDNKPSLSAVAVSGNYSDIIGTPSFSAVATTNDYDDLDNKPSLSAVATTNDYDDLDNKPSLSAVATTNDYDDLDNKPSLSAVAVSGNYTDLINKPTLSTVASTGNYTDLSNRPTLGTMAEQAAADYTPSSLLSSVATSGNYDDIINKPSLSAVAVSGNYSDIIGTPSFSAVATTGSYNDLTDTPTIPAQVNLIEGSNITITGSYPNLTVSASGTIGTNWDAIGGDQSDVNLSGFTKDLKINDLTDVDVDGGQSNGDVLRWTSGNSTFETYSLGTMADEDINDYYTKTQVNDTLSNYPLYSEGTFTAVFIGDSSGTVSAVNQQYSRIGNQYTIYIDAQVNLSSFVGSISITGFPNSATTNIISVSAVYHDPNITYDANSQQVIAKKVSTDTIKLYFVDNTSGSSEHNVEGSDFTGVGRLQFTMTYLGIDKQTTPE